MRPCPYLLLTLLPIITACEKANETPLKNTPYIKLETPVLIRDPFPAYDFYAASDCWVIRDNNVYKMWYTSAGILPNQAFRARISYATSVDGIHWEKYVSNPVVDDALRSDR